MQSAPSEDSDQPGHSHSFLRAGSVDSAQSGHMLRLILVFVGRTCHFVGFVVWRLIFPGVGTCTQV